MTLESATRFQAEQSSPFELKGSLFTLTVLHLRKADSKAIAYHLAQKARQAPEFFKNLPVVIDLDSLDPTAELDFAELYELLRRNGLIPVGVRNASSQLQTAAIRADIPLLLENRSDTAKAAQEKLLPPSPGAPVPLPEGTPQYNKIVTHPIRSGQQVYVPNGDLIVLGPISAGSELLADGNIHVYGTLRGRALAGVKGNTQARIFCQLLEAELVSVAGHYRVIEDLDKDNPGKPVQLYLEENRLIISPLFK